MEICLIKAALPKIPWLWFALSVVVVYGIGALWYSKLFAKAWVRVFKVDMPQQGEKPKGMMATMLIQLFATIILGLIMFIVTIILKPLAIFVLIAFCIWQKASLKFRFTKWNDFATAALIEVGYTFVAGMVFFLFVLALGLHL